MHISTWGEALFGLVMLLPFALFCGFTFYLWRLMLAAAGASKQIEVMTPPALEEEPGQVIDLRERFARSAGNEGAIEKPTRFVILIPAHNEAMNIQAVLKGLRKIDYPSDLFRVVVIADNCEDATAQLARQEGAIALERTNTEERGKGYALEWALKSLLKDELFCLDAVVILDADTFVSPNLLRAFAEGMKNGHKVLQVRYEVLNVSETWRTRLMAAALCLAHIVKPLGRERLQLSEGLKGNGMCFVRETLETVPWSGASITEDIEYTLRLCRAGFRVAFLPNAAVWAQMPTDSKQAQGQRDRWERGRYLLLRTEAPKLLIEGLRKRNPILLDRAMELIIPPFAELFAGPVVLGAISAGVALGTGWPIATLYAAGWGGVLLLEAGYLFGGLKVAKAPKEVVKSVLYAPFYMVWKFGVYVVMLVKRGGGGWNRTERRKIDNA